MVRRRGNNRGVVAGYPSFRSPNAAPTFAANNGRGANGSGGRTRVPYGRGNFRGRGRGANVAMAGGPVSDSGAMFADSEPMQDYEDGGDYSQEDQSQFFCSQQQGQDGSGDQGFLPVPMDQSNKPGGPPTPLPKWEKVRKMHMYRLRLLPLDILHILDEGRRAGQQVSLLEGQQKKLEALSSMNNSDFLMKCIEPLELNCDCCQIDFSGSNKINEMFAHIETEEHFNNLRSKIAQDMLYGYKMNKTCRIPPVVNAQSNAASKRKPGSTQQGQQQKHGVTPLQASLSAGGKAAASATSGEPTSKKAKKSDEDNAHMADWVACYICNTTCSGVAAYQTHAAGKRHQRLCGLAPKHLQELPFGPYILDGRPTIDTSLGVIKLAAGANGQVSRVGGEQEHLLNPAVLPKLREFYASAMNTTATA